MASLIISELLKQQTTKHFIALLRTVLLSQAGVGVCSHDAVNNCIHNYQHLLTHGLQNDIHCILVTFVFVENAVYAIVQDICL